MIKVIFLKCSCLHQGKISQLDQPALHRDFLKRDKNIAQTRAWHLLGERLARAFLAMLCQQILCAFATLTTLTGYPKLIA